MYNNQQCSNKILPREKARVYGIKTLSDLELISIIIGTGTKGTPVKQMAGKILDLIDKNNGEITIDKLVGINGVGNAKATVLGACMEFSRRRLTPSNKKVTYPSDILSAVRHFVTRAQEYFIVISLNGAHEIIKSNIISIGILNRTLIHPREVFSDALKDRAASIILSHNHPSGNLSPSPEDREVTKRLVDVGELLGIKVLDHVIFSDKNYFSFIEEGIM